MRRKFSIPLIEHLPKNRLPTEIQVLGHFLWLRTLQTDRSSPRAAATITVRHVMQIWDIAYIKTIKEANVLRYFFILKSSLVQR